MLIFFLNVIRAYQTSIDKKFGADFKMLHDQSKPEKITLFIL
jgi:hypothetical protein